MLAEWVPAAGPSPRPSPRSTEEREYESLRFSLLRPDFADQR